MKRVNTEYLLEICCYGAADVQTAYQAKAHRAELCANQYVGGTTPSIGDLQMAKKLCPDFPVYVMIRPRGGNFVYSNIEKMTMLNDAEMMLKYGADGLVFGALMPDGSIDKTFCKNMLSIESNISFTFHRAIDICTNKIVALDFLIEHHVENILSSGGKNKAIEGIDEIQRMIEFAQDRINIIAGSGINENNISSFIDRGLRFFHSSASVLVEQNNYHGEINFNAQLNNNQWSVVSDKKIKNMLAVINAHQS
ncbi:MAG: copper homeostasis protein CutC [Bacteroidia bacterium]|nr:copper homeostasis protein CutC [Bacteroidia bacterium]MCZ2249851.1 copper homeostasis protein CutC [Bacteroidia bacterium]